MKIQWEYDLVEKPFCEQLKTMGWQWLEGDTDVPDFTKRRSFREVLLKGRLAAALRKLNLRDGQPWLDDARIARAIRDLEQAAGHRLMEINQSATELRLKGTEADGLPDWNYGRPQPVQFIDFKGRADQRARACHPGRGTVRKRHPAGGGGVQEPGQPESTAGGYQPAPALLEPAPRTLPHALHRERGCRAPVPHQPAPYRRMAW
jgi:type I restriction enzyme R subunit